MMLPYGWAGVDVFFVLSGFLITGLLRKHRTDESYWGPFYLKRATRILPAMIAAILLGLVIFPIPWHTLWPYYTFFGANLANVYHPDRIFSFSVLWSLAVEEHFYLIWPIAVRWLTRRNLIRLLVSLLLLEPILRLIAMHFLHSFWVVFYVTPFRLDGIAGGSLLALLVEDERAVHYLRKWSAGMAIFSFGVFGAAILLFHSFRRENNSLWFNSLAYTLIAAAAFFFVAYVVTNEKAWVSRILATPGLVFMGTISYGMYLFHVLLIPWLESEAKRFHLHHGAIFVLLATVVLTIAFSWVSFNFYERPITNWGRRRAKDFSAAHASVPASLL